MKYPLIFLVGAASLVFAASLVSVSGQAGAEMPPLNCSVNGTRYVDPTNCSRYYRCWNETADLLSCDKNWVFNGSSLTCTQYQQGICGDRFDPWIVVTTEAPQPPYVAQCWNRNGLFPVKDGCSIYVSCQDWKPTEMKCPMHTQFNPEISRCDFKYNIPESSEFTRYCQSLAKNSK